MVIFYSYVRLLKDSKAIIHHQYVDALYIFVPLVDGKIGDGFMVYYCFAHMILDSSKTSSVEIQHRRL